MNSSTPLFLSSYKFPSYRHMLNLIVHVKTGITERTMPSPPARCLFSVAFAIAIIISCSATDHTVGNSIWSIPRNNDFYNNWSNNKTFVAGDFLVFRFDTGLSDVTQVSRREYEGCTAENPFRRILVGPAKVSLNEEGMAYFICSFGNYCSLGQKISVPVQRALL